MKLSNWPPLGYMLGLPIIVQTTNGVREMVIVRIDIHALATPHEALENYRSVLSPQFQLVIIRSVMNFIPKMVNPKLPWALKFAYANRRRSPSRSSRHDVVEHSNRDRCAPMSSLP